MYTQFEFSSAAKAKKYLSSINCDDALPSIVIKNNIIEILAHPDNTKDTSKKGRQFLAIGLRTSFANFLNNKDFADIKIIVNQGNATKKYYAHKIILSNCCDFFSGALGVGDKSNTIRIEENIDRFYKLLSIMYGDPVRIVGKEGLKILQLMDKYGVILDKNYDMDTYIAAMSVPEKGEMLEFMEELQNIYQDPENMPKIVIRNIKYFLEYLEGSVSTKFYESLWKYLPRTIQKEYSHLLEESDYEVGGESESDE